MNVNYSFLDHNFKELKTYSNICFGSIQHQKTGTYISYDISIINTKHNRKFYREMVKLWGNFLERPAKPIKEMNHIILDMDKHSINLILSVFSSFRFMDESPQLVDYYCYLRNKYRKLPILTALLLGQAAGYPAGQNHCFIPWSGVSSNEFAFTVLMNVSLEEKFKGQNPMNLSGVFAVHSSWGYDTNWYAARDFEYRKELAEKLIVKMFYKKGRK